MDVSVAESDLLQRGLIAGGRCEARERDRACARTRSGDARWRRSVKDQDVVRLWVGQRDRCRGEVLTVAVDDQDVAIRDGGRRAALRETREIVRAGRGGVVWVVGGDRSGGETAELQ